MYFRSTQHARNLYIRNESKWYLGDMDIYLGGPGEVSVKLRNATVEERRIEKSLGAQSPKLFCYATSRREPDDAVHAMFKSVSRGELPKGGVVPKDEEWIYYGLPEPDVGPGADPPPPLPDPLPQPQAPPQLRWMPPQFKDFFSDVQDELHEAVRRTVSAFRWRGAIKGPHNPLSTADIEWSFDGKTWESFKDDGSGRMIRVGDSTTVRVTDKVRGDVETIISHGIPEPIGHELFREAWALRHSSPRSALVIGVAALEAGVKDCITDFVPEAKWLVEKGPSPPVLAMLTKYLPTLPASTFDGKISPPPKALRKTIDEAVQIRNRVAHVGEGVTPAKV